TKGSLLQVNLTANTDLHTADDFKKLVVREDKGTLIRLGDIADVVLGAEDYNAEVRFSGQKAVFMGIYVLPNANSVDVIKRVRIEMEQIKRELPSGMNAALKGARELVGPIIAMTLTLATVYTPIALQGGLTGALFREFALTLAGAVLISGIVALTLSPMMAAHLLRPEHVDHGFSGWVNRTFDRFREWYGSHLDRTLKALSAVYLYWAGVSVLSIVN